MTPTQIALSHYTLPFELKPFQVEVIDDLGPLTEEGYYLSMGTGKTCTSTVTALFHKVYYGNRCVVIMPPILLKQWETWLKSIKPALKVVKYAGTPSERAAMSLDADFVLVGVQIFKKEYEKFTKAFADVALTVIIDEANMVSNISTDNHEKLYDFCLGRHKLLLTGTPMNNPGDAYGLLKFVAPGIYRNKAQFLRIHAKSVDMFNNVTKWDNLDLLAKNMTVNAKRVLLEDIYDEMPEVTYTPLEYDLDPKHARLYRKLAEEELLRLPDGGKIDATTANKLTHALGQVIVNYGHFSGDHSLVSKSVDMAEELLEELGGGKLLMFANYRMSIALLVEKLAKYVAVGVNSEVTSSQKEKNIEKFIHDPSCRVMVAQVRSAGFGLDGLQAVANTIFYIEPCSSPRDFHQSVARLVRQGQSRPVQVYMGVAAGTLQRRAFNNLMKNDSLVNSVIRNAADLRDLVLGD